MPDGPKYAWDLTTDKQLIRDLDRFTRRARTMCEQGEPRTTIIRVLLQVELGLVELRRRGMQVGLFDLDAYPAPPASGVEPIGRAK
jgi:hypothetical protein